jgi:hypothetical protein
MFYFVYIPICPPQIFSFSELIIITHTNGPTHHCRMKIPKVDEDGRLYPSHHNHR